MESNVHPIRLLTIRQLQDALGCKKSKIYEDIKRGIFKPVKIGRCTRFVQEEVDSYIRQRMAAREMPKAA